MAQTLAEALDIPFSQRTAEYERYQVLGELGVGGMGRVYKAHDQKLDRDVAIKVMILDGHHEEEDVADLKQRFYREAKIVASLRHPNVLQMLDYSGQDAPVPFIVTELLEGTDLDALIDVGPIPEKVVAAIGYYVAQALMHAHEHQIVHRDIKPQNIFIETGGRVVLIDFGVAKGLRSSNTRLTFMKSRTKVVGTALFSAPEQIKSNEPPGPPADLFSLGGMIYYAMSQVLPFPGQTARDVLIKVVNDDPMPLEQLIECSSAMWKIVRQSLEKMPEQRPANAGVVAALLKPLAIDPAHTSLEEAIASYISGVKERAGSDTQVAAAAADAPELTAELLEPTRPKIATPRPAVPDVVTQVTNVASVSQETQVANVGQMQRADRTNIITAEMRLSKRPGAKHAQGKKGLRPLHYALMAVACVTLLVTTILVSASKAPPPVVTRVETELAAPVAPAALTMARLRVLVKPWGHVKIDGVDRGRTPVFRVADLPLGKHAVFVTNPDFGEREVTVELSEPNREESVTVDFTTGH